MTAAYDALADAYQAGRIGYSSDLYNVLAGFGLAARHRVLDVACGTGLASRPLIEGGLKVTGVDASEEMLERARARFPGATWERGSAEKLPFGDGTFDVAICAQAIHHLDRKAAIAEMMRAIKPGGLVAIWWKSLVGEDPVKMLRDDVADDLGVDPPQSGLAGGFKEFYAAPFAEHALRVIPWHTTVGLEEYLAYERSRKIVYDVMRGQAESYFKNLERRLRETFGAGNPRIPLGYMQFMYLGRTV
ncbi:MAG TPA: class I SAM-dependent methyltransferase [Verrucomicrobiae bacterium]|nr:class I SAM-dependent methyltransferase [Verrucomicrobiae bacterium]